MRMNKWRDLAEDMKPGQRVRVWCRADANSLCRALRDRGHVGTLAMCKRSKGSFVVVKLDL